MDEERFNLSLRKFLKQVGVTSQREIENLVRENGLQSGQLDVEVTLTVKGQPLEHKVQGVIDLGD